MQPYGLLIEDGDGDVEIGGKGGPEEVGQEAPESSFRKFE